MKGRVRQQTLPVRAPRIRKIGKKRTSRLRPPTIAARLTQKFLGRITIWHTNPTRKRGEPRLRVGLVFHRVEPPQELQVPGTVRLVNQRGIALERSTDGLRHDCRTALRGQTDGPEGPSCRLELSGKFAEYPDRDNFPEQDCTGHRQKPRQPNDAASLTQTGQQSEVRVARIIGNSGNFLQSIPFLLR